MDVVGKSVNTVNTTFSFVHAVSLFFKLICIVAFSLSFIHSHLLSLGIVGAVSEFPMAGPPAFMLSAQLRQDFVRILTRQQ